MSEAPADAVIRRFAEVVEFRVEIEEAAALNRVDIHVELAPGAAADVAGRLQQAIRDELMFRAEVHVVEAGSLPRFDMKSRRFVRKQV